MTAKVNWVSSFPEGELDNYIHTNEKILLVALDTEYTRVSFSGNLCLSYQCAVLDCATGEYKKVIDYPDLETRTRRSLKEILLFAFNMMGIAENEIDGYHVILICHTCSAEWAMMRDRKETSKYLEFLYHTVITFKPINIDFKLSDGSPCKVTFEVGDTLLLLPPSHRKLDKAISLLDDKYSKKELTQFEIEHMRILLETDKERFEEYAINDADITLRLFIKLQYTLNALNDSDDTRYTTIGSATVKHFIKGIDPVTFKSQFAKNNEIYQKGLNLAKRAYNGGLNSSYYLGEIKGELIIDIDYNTAYPTVMNLLEISDFGKPLKKEKPKELLLEVAS